MMQTQRSITIAALVCCLLLLLVATLAEKTTEIVVTAGGEAVIGSVEHEPTKRQTDATAVDVVSDISQQDSAKVKSSATKYDAKDAEDALHILQSELQQVETLIQLQETKLRYLEKLRNSVLDDSTLSPHQAAKRKSVDMAATIARDLDFITAQAMETPSILHFDNYFVEKTVVPVSAMIADMKMAKFRGNNHVELIVIATVDGFIDLRIAPATTLLRFKTAIAGIHSIALDTISDQPTLSVLYQEARRVDVYALKFTQDGTRLWETALLNSTKSELLLTDILPQLELQVKLISSIKLSNVAQTLVLTGSARRSVLGVGYRTGELEFYSVNGTQLRQISTKAPLQFLVPSTNMLAFGNGTDTVILPTSRSKAIEFRRCLGSTGAATAVAFDAIQPHVLYTGTAHGEILVHQLDGSCRLLFRTVTNHHRHQRSPILQLATLKSGHVLATTASSMLVFNTTRTNDLQIQMHQMMARRLPSSSNYTSLVVSEGTTTTHVAVTTVTNDQSELVVLQSLLPSKAEQTDPYALRYMYFGLIIVGVVGSQMYFRRNQQNRLQEAEIPWEKLGKSEFSTRRTERRVFSDRHQTDNIQNKLREKYGASYDSLSDDLRRKIAEARRDTMECTLDD